MKMKVETKRKILKFVKKLIRYSETADAGMTININKADILRIRSEHIYSNYELLMISEEQVNFASSMNIVEELNRNKLIKFERIPYTIHTTDLANKTKDMTKIIAELKVVTQ